MREEENSIASAWSGKSKRNVGLSHDDKTIRDRTFATASPSQAFISKACYGLFQFDCEIISDCQRNGIWLTFIQRPLSTVLQRRAVDNGRCVDRRSTPHEWGIKGVECPPPGEII